MAAKKAASTDQLKSAALEYAKRGLRVFPLHSIRADGACACRNPKCDDVGKHPAIKWGKGATTDATQIERWWTQHPDRGIGIATGKDSGITVLDLDGEEGIADATERCGGTLPLTPRVRTGGGGLHLYFKHDPGVKNNAKKIGPNIDARNDGGFVVAPPSLHASGNHYEWEIGASVDLAEWPEALRIEAVPAKAKRVKIAAKLQKFTLRQIEGALKFVSADERDTWRHVGIILGREYGQRTEAWDVYCEWASKWDGVPKRNHEETMRECFYKLSNEKASGSELTIGTLIDLAQKAGWVPRPDSELENFFYILPAAKFLYRPSGELWTPEAVNVAQAPVVVGKNKKGKDIRVKAAHWIQQNRSIASVVFDPSEPDVIEDMVAREQGMVEHIGARVLNKYYAPKLKLGDAAQATPYVDHVRMLYPQAEIADHILDWLAQRVQFPGRKVRHALLIGGDQGVGKDTIIEAAIPAIGQWNAIGISPNDLFTPYDDHKAKVLIRINEVADLHDVNRYKFYEATKNLIAGTPDWTTVNQKYGAKYSVRNVAGVILTTNHIGVGLYIAADDRRHFVAEAKHASELWNGDKEAREEYFTKLWQWLYAGGFMHVAAFLHDRDLSHFDPNAPPPKTDAFHNLVGNGAVSDAWLVDALDALENPELVRVDRLKLYIHESMDAKEINRNLAPAMQRMGYEVYRDPNNRKDGRSTFNDAGPNGGVKRTMVYLKIGFRTGKTPAEVGTAIKSLARS